MLTALDPLSPLPALAAVLLFLGCGALLGRVQHHVPAPGRYATIDGLRGFLAFFVFLHHSAYWYFFLRTGRWGGIDSHLYLHFGESSVMMFFMITSFLFASKVLDAEARPIDWRRLYLGRVMRLTPLYLVAMLVLFTLVAVESDFTRRVPVAALLRDAAIWLGFSIFGQPDLNGVPQATNLIAGVTWSLPFEWLLYAALPVFAWLLRRRTPWPWLLGGLLVASVIAWEQRNPLAFRSFAVGIGAAFAVRHAPLRAACTSRVAGLLAVLCIVAAVIVRPSAYSGTTAPLIGMAFVIIACGHSLFGLLSLPASRVIGEMGYSIYLLHGAVLTITFRYLIGVERTVQLTPLQHWLVVLAVVPVLFVVCALSFRWIEQPGIAAGQRWEARLQRRAPASVRAPC